MLTTEAEASFEKKKKIFKNQCQTSFHVGLERRLSNVREPSVCLPLACRQETLLGISNTMNRQKVDY